MRIKSFIFSLIFTVVIFGCSGIQQQAGETVGTDVQREGPTNAPPSSGPVVTSKSAGIKSVLPPDRSVDNVLRPKVEIEFDSWNEEMFGYTFKITPQINGDVLWNSLRNKIRFDVKQDLAPDTEYTVSIINPAGSVVGNWTFQTMGGLGIRSVFPSANSIQPLDTNLQFEYTDEASLMKSLDTVLGIEGTGGGKSFTTANGQWKPDKLLPHGKDYKGTISTRYTDQSGDVRNQFFSWTFKTPFLFTKMLPDMKKMNQEDIGYDVVVGPKSGDLYVIGMQMLTDSPVVWFARFNKSGTKVWERLLELNLYMNIPAGIAVDKNEQNIFIVSSLYGDDGYAHRIFKYNVDGKYLANVSYDPFPGSFLFDYAKGVAVDDKYVYVVGSEVINQAHALKSQLSVSSYNVSDLKEVKHFKKSIGDYSSANSVKIGPDGLIYVAGYTGTYSTKKTVPWIGAFDSDLNLISENVFSGATSAVGYQLFDIDVINDAGGTPNLYAIGSDGTNLIWEIYKHDSTAKKLELVRSVKEAKAKEGRGISVKDISGEKRVYVSGYKMSGSNRNIFVQVYKEDGADFSATPPDASVKIVGNAEGYGIDASSDGTFVAVGYVPFEANSNTARDVWLTRYMSDYSIPWTVAYDNPNKGKATISDIEVAGDGDMAILANYGGNNIYDAKVITYSKDGVEKWRANYPKATEEFWPLLVMGEDKSVYICGFNFNGKGMNFSKTDSTGKLVWEFDRDISFFGNIAYCYSGAGDKDGYSYFGITKHSLKGISIVKLCGSQTGQKCNSEMWKQDIAVKFGYVKGIYIIPNDRLFVVTEEFDGSNNYLRFYILSTVDGKNMDGTTPPKPIEKSPILYSSGTQTKSTALDKDGNIVFVWETPASVNGGVDKVCKMSQQGELNCFADVNLADPVFVLAVDDDGRIFARSLGWGRSSQRMLTGGIIHGIPFIGEQKLVIFNPDGSVFSERALFDGVLDLFTTAVVSPDQTIILGGRKFIVNTEVGPDQCDVVDSCTGAVGLIQKCDMHGNCL